MANRKLVRDLFFSRHPFFLHLTSPQSLSTRLQYLSANGYLDCRRFSVFNEFSKRLKEEAKRNEEFQQSVNKLKEKDNERKWVKDELKVRTKQTSEWLYECVDGVWVEAEATAKKVSANVQEKILAATEEVTETFGIGKKESAGSSNASARDGADLQDHSEASSGGETHKQTGSSDTAETFFGKFKSSIPSSKVSFTFQRLKEANVSGLVKKGYDIVKNELNGKPSGRRHLEYSPPFFKGQISTKTDIVVLHSKQSQWSKKWDAFKEKVQDHPLFKHFTGLTEPVVTKGKEIAEDMWERWETSDNPIVHKIQDVSDTLFRETDAAASIKEIRYRDPSFSLPDFAAEIQEAIRPVLNAYMKGDTETLKKYCSPEMIIWCEAELKAFQSHGIFFDNKILHISEVEVKETKMMGSSPVIIVAFRTQQVYCVCDQNGSITEGGKDTIHTVYHVWAMQQVDPEEPGEGAFYPIWKLREMQQLGVQALI